MEGNRVVLDSGALSSLAEEEGGIRFALSKALAARSVVVLPAIVLVETTTGNGPRDARVNRVAKGFLVEELDETLARAAAMLRFRYPEFGVVDAVVMATADAYPGSVVLTGDARDLRALATVRGVTAVVAI